jgi:hypothetical protein
MIMNILAPIVLLVKYLTLVQIGCNFDYSKLLDIKQNPFSVRRIILIILACFISSTIMAQKVNFDTLNIDQLNMYKDNSIKMRNTGRALTFSGAGIMVTSTLIGVIYSFSELGGAFNQPSG